MIFLNQKMNLTKDELEKIINDIKDLDVVLIPTMPLLSLASSQFSKIGSQDVSEYEKGSYTGQTSIQTLKSLKVKYCLIGHSEKREYLNETNEKIIKKIKLCIENNIIPILIVGETSEEYEKQTSKQIIEKKITDVFNNLQCPLTNIIICYEPIWSIGKISPSKEIVVEMVNYIKEIIKEKYNLNLPLLYGGGVNETNILELNTIDAIDGFLVGNVSLDSQRILKIYNLIK